MESFDRFGTLQLDGGSRGSALRGEILAKFGRLLAERSNNRKAPMTVSYLERKLGCSRAEAFGLLKYVESLGFGQVVLGRRGHDTRIMWGRAGAFLVLDYLTSPHPVAPREAVC